MHSISIIIPTLNESGNIRELIRFLMDHGGSYIKEIIVSDGGSTDNTVLLAKEAGAVVVISLVKGRAGQMNSGAAQASGDIFYFVHADTFPPVSFARDIQEAVEAGYAFGRYRTKFDSPKKILLFNAWFTRFDLFICYGGDQTLFIQKALFQKIQGFNSQMRIMEDYDIVVRAKEQKARYKIFKKAALVSARKYETNSWIQVQWANYTIIRMYKKGAGQDEMVNTYKSLLQYR